MKNFLKKILILIDNINKKLNLKRWLKFYEILQKDYLDAEYWLVNSSRSKIKRFDKKKQNKNKFFEYIFIDSGIISGVFGKINLCYGYKRIIEDKKT